MPKPDFEQARTYALNRLQNELPAYLLYHSPAHTSEEVVPAVVQLAAMEGIRGESALILRTAAYFHDIGYIEKSNGHEAASAQIAADVLPGFGFNQDQIQAIQSMILATELPQSPKNLLEQILADADLDILGRASFMRRNQDLRAEIASQGKDFSDEEWYLRQLNLLKSHQYWTPSARALRSAQKQANITALTKKLVECKEQIGKTST